MLMTAPATAMDRAARPGTLLEMLYRNDSGEVSRRRVRVVGWIHGRNGFSYLRGWCFLRGEERTFRADRVLEWRLESPAAGPAPATAAPVVLAPAAVPVQPSVPVPAAAPVSAASSRRGPKVFLWLAGLGVAALIVRGLVSAGSPPAPRHLPTPRAVPRATVVPAPKPAPRPAPRPAERDAAAGAARAAAFRGVTGIADSDLEALYEKADTDSNGRLAWTELRSFQSELERTYCYLANEPALRPDEFAARGGGDCEDWALFTCGLLRYWGWDPWVGSFGPADGGTGHAVCMVRLAEKPSRFAWWSIAQDGTMGGVPVKAGWYVPVDYEHVGELSDAVEDGWKLRALWRPESIYGERM